MNPDAADHDTKVKHFFDKRVAAYDAFYDPPSRVSRWFNHVFRKAVYRRRDHTLTLAKRYGCRTLLDVGCGSGRNSVWFARNGIESIVGIDVSAEMVAEAAKIAEQAGVAERCKFHHVDFMEMATGPRFDLVVALGVFDYVEDAAEFLRRMVQFADSVVYGSFPTWTLVRTPLRKLRYTLRGCPTHFYRRGQVVRLLEDLQFGAVQVVPVPGGFLASAGRPVPTSESA